MMWDIGGHDMSTTSERNHSRSPQLPQMRMPSPAFPIPDNHGETLGGMGSCFVASMSSSYPPVPASADYNSHAFYTGYPSIRPVPFPPIIHHSKHHSSSKHEHHHHHKHPGHGHLHPHSHSHSQHHLPFPSPSQMTSFPTTPSTSFHIPTPPIHFPTIPHRPLIHVSSSNNVREPLPRGRIQSMSPLQHINKPKAISILPKLARLPTEPMNFNFQYSKCTGRRRALCIGINYRGQENELRGCINDARNVRKFLQRNNYKSNEIVMLSDDTNDPRMLPTRNNILEAMRWLVHGAKPNDSLFFHYSGHGGQTPDLDGDEADGWDEVIFPLDFKKNGHIVDDLMHDIMVKPLPRGCRLTGLFDACHSGSVLDLPYVYSSHGRLRGSPITPGARARKATPADVISWSACKDGQTSADTFAGGVAVGAMSYAFITAITNKPDQTYQELFRSIRLILNPRYSQKPQLGSSHHIDTQLRFIF